MLKAQFKKYILKFKIPSGTSRGVLREKPLGLLKFSMILIQKYLGLENAVLLKD